MFLLRWLWLLSLLSCISAAEQVTGEFYLDKSVFATGEPVILHFRVTNNAPKAINILQADPYSFCSGYEIVVSSGASSDQTGAVSPCVSGFAGDCLSSDINLRPGASRIETILLNFDHEIRRPGDYEVNAVRKLPYADAAVDYFKAPKDQIETRMKLYFRVDQTLDSDPAMFQSLVNQLHARDSVQRMEAARTLASSAPPTLEDTLLSFSDNQEFRQFAPLAFHNLNTAKSMAAMAELLNKTQPGSYEHMTSAGYLAESRDARWFPLLVEVARNNAKIGNYVSDAAELGGEKMLSTLKELMNSPDKEFTRPNAITGLGYTKTRAAVPVLIDLLRSPEPNTAEYAESALGILTHRTSGENPNQAQESRYLRWSQWWSREGATAPIYAGTECGETIPIK